MAAIGRILARLTAGRAVLMAVAGVVIALIVVFFVARLSAGREVDQLLDAIRAAGQPVTLLELDRTYADTAEARSRGAALTNLLDRLSGLNRELDGINGGQLQAFPVVGGASLPAPGVRLDSETRQLVDSGLATMQPVLGGLHVLLMTEPVPYRQVVSLTNGANTLLPHLSRFKSAETWLRLRAAVELEDEEPDAATGTIIDMLRLTRTLEDEPFPISQQVRLSALNQAYLALERLLALDRQPAGDLARLRHALQLANRTNAVYRAMLGERCIGVSLLWDASNSFAQVDSLGLAGGGGKGTAQQTIINLLYRMSGLRERETRLFLQHLNRAIAAGTNSLPVRLRVAGELASANVPRWPPFVGLLIPRLGKPYQMEADAIARAVLLDAALAVAEFKKRHGRLPVDLDELVPDHLPAVPVDPRDDSVLSLASDANGFQIGGRGPALVIRYADGETVDRLSE